MRVINLNNSKADGRHERYICIDIHEVLGLEKFAQETCPDHNREILQSVHGASQGTQDYNDPYDGHAPRSFYLGRLKSIKSVRDRLTKGWQGGADKAMKLAETLEGAVAQPVDIRRRVSWGERGDEFSRERLLDGHFDSAWRSTTRRIAIANPIINVVVGWGGNAGRSHDELFWSGAAALALCNVLEKAGYQTTLTAMAVNRYGNERAEENGPQRHHRHTVCCRLKGAGEYMRPDALAGVVCSPATFRTFVFYTMCATHHPTTRALGNMTNVDAIVPHAVAAGAIEVPQVVLPDCFNEMAAEMAVKNALRHLADANLAALPEGVDW